MVGFSALWRGVRISMRVLSLSTGLPSEIKSGIEIDFYTFRGRGPIGKDNIKLFGWYVEIGIEIMI